MQRKLTTVYASTVLALVPLFTHAQGNPPPRNLKDLVGIVKGIVDLLIPIVVALMFLTFLWGIYKSWIAAGGDREAVDAGKQIAWVGILGFVVSLSIWGILSILQYTLFGVR